VLPIVPYGDLDAVLDRITSAPHLHPLVLYVFGGMALADRWCRRRRLVVLE